MSSFQITGQLVDLHQQRIYPACITVESGRIQSIEALSDNSSKGPFIMPGFVDSHVHIESSLLVPSAFASLSVIHGTVATISDPPEIANVCGMEGVNFMIVSIDLYLFYCQTVRMVFKYVNINTISPDNRC